MTNREPQSAMGLCGCGDEGKLCPRCGSCLLACCECEPQPESDAVVTPTLPKVLPGPIGYAYQYPDGIRFDTGGSSINGSQPSRSFPVYDLTAIQSAICDAVEQERSEARRMVAQARLGEIERMPHDTDCKVGQWIGTGMFTSDCTCYRGERIATLEAEAK